MELINVVAPIYNEENNIRELVRRVSKSISKVTSNFKIILIDDGSTDSSWTEIKLCCKKNNKVIGIKLSRNFGHHYAITAGIHHSNSKWVVVMDSDLQDRPEVIPQLYAKAIEGHDAVFVSRIQRQEPKYYLILQKIFYFVLKLLSGIKFDSRQANFSIISRKVVESFKQFPERSRFYNSTILWLGFNRTSIYAKHGIRYRGKPSYSFKRRLKLASDIVLAFSDRPLKISIYLGLFISLTAFLVVNVCVYLYFFKDVNFDTTIWILLTQILLSGIIIFVLGIIGIYLGQTFNQVKNRPLYIIQEFISK